jgi:hypothetical protein
MTEADFAVIGIDAATITSVYLSAFGWIITSWFLGAVVGIVKNTIQKA